MSNNKKNQENEKKLPPVDMNEPEEAVANQENIDDDDDVKIFASPDTSPAEAEAENEPDMFNLTAADTYTDLSIDEENTSRTQTKVAVLPKRLTEKYVKTDKPKKKSWFEPAGYTETVSSIHSVLKTVVFIIFITMLGCFLAYYAITRINDLYAFVKPSDEVEITIPENATVGEITDILYDAGIIEYPSFFKLYAEIKNASEVYEFVAGTYVLSPMMNYDEIFIKLEGTLERTIKRITIPEGYSVDEIIDLFVSEGLGTREGFVNTIQNYDFEYDFIDELNTLDLSKRKYRLEGYLYPDTYEFYTEKSEAYYIYKLLDRFEEMYNDEFKKRADDLGYSMNQIITIASMIEKEAKFHADFEFVSEVFHNRLKNPSSYPKLESDATVLYAYEMVNGEKLTEVLPEHLTVESPYNTYLVSGLPEGPISNPGFEAILAALYPEVKGYYYFVSSLDGTTLFGETYSEHQKNIKAVKELDDKFLAGGR